METPPSIKLYKQLLNKALQLRNESERMLFLAVFAALGVTSSAGVGFLFDYSTTIPFGLIIGTVLSSFILIPIFLLIGTTLWARLIKSRALSGDDFDFLSYLKDEYDREVREINSLPLPDSEKKKLIKERYDGYIMRRDIIKKRIEELNARRKSWYYLRE